MDLFSRSFVSFAFRSDKERPIFLDNLFREAGLDVVDSLKVVVGGLAEGDDGGSGVRELEGDLFSETELDFAD